MRRVLEVLTPGRALDAASGTGRWTSLLSNCGWSVVSCDQSSRMIDILKRRSMLYAHSIECIVHDLNHTLDTLPDRSFDLVICSFASCHIERLVVTISDFGILLRENALLIISNIHPDALKDIGAYFTLTVGEKDYEVPIIWRSVEEYHRLIAEANLRLVGMITAPAVFDVKYEAGVVSFFAIR